MTGASPKRRLRIHIGHHFFGAGNIGDDLMLAGFERVARPFLDRFSFTCCIPPEHRSQIRRFPFIDWRPYDLSEREACVVECNAWLGLGDSPFQSDSGPWFLDHLQQELLLCSKHGRPMYFLGVGVNDCESLSYPQTSALLGYASGIWTRDAHSLSLVLSASPACRAVEGGDLANIEFAAHPKPDLNPKELAFCLNFETLPVEFLPKFCALVEGLSGRTLVWLRQETRELPWSESTLMNMLPKSLQERFVQREVDYSTDSLGHLLNTLSGSGSLITSRYHSGLAGAWQGSRVALYCRNEKLRGLADQFDMATFDDFTAQEVAFALARPQEVRRDRLSKAADRAEAASREFFAAVLG